MYKRKLKIGITSHVFVCWTGGVDYLTSIVQCLLDKEEIELVIIIPDKESHLKRVYSYFKNLLSLKSTKLSSPGKEVIDLSNLRTSLPTYVKFQSISSGVIPLLQLCLKEKIDILLPVMIPLPKYFPLGYISYIPDFQYKHMPENFTEKDIKLRDRLNKRILTNAKAILLGANEVEKDVKQFFPGLKVATYVLPLIATPKKEWLLDSNQEVNLKYNLKRKYFIVSNQFWKHKNHQLLFEAFHQFCKVNSDVDLVCTGLMDDYRNDDYIKDLKLLIENFNFGDRLHLLGVIPKLEQISLLKNAMALIQPTLFEGGPGGGSVYDGVSLGKICLVSNIPVNRELKEDNVVFFDPYNSDELKNLMISISNSPVYNTPIDILNIKCEVRRENAFDIIISSINHVLTSKKTYGNSIYLS